MKRCVCGAMPVMVKDFGKEDGEYSILPSVHIVCESCGASTKRHKYLLDREYAEARAMSGWDNDVI